LGLGCEIFYRLGDRLPNIGNIGNLQGSGQNSVAALNALRQHNDFTFFLLVNRASGGMEAYDEDINDILGSYRTARGAAYTYTEQSLSDSVRRNEKWREENEKIKRELLHLKDEHNISDKGLDAIDKFFKKHKKFFSIHYVRKTRKEVNQKFPIFNVIDGAYVQFEYAIKTAVFIAQRKNPNLHQLPQITFRLNMDGTLIGNKHIVAISVNCVEGGRDCQSLKNLLIKLHGRFSGHLQDLFFQNFPYEELLDGNAIVHIDPLKRKKNLKTACVEFLETFTSACLRNNVTPYLHIIGNHLFEFDEREDLGAFNIQGMEKGNDFLSRLYFSSTNAAKKPLYTMMQKLYRPLEMGLTPDDREEIFKFMSTQVYDYEDDDFIVVADANGQASVNLPHVENDYEVITSGSNDSSSDTDDENHSDDGTESAWFHLGNRKILTANRFGSFKRSKKS
ncbi:unnamed protein product, partial [Didymodactylos carnosus]